MVYIKRRIASFLLALAHLSVVSLSLMSCSESVGMSGVTLSDKKISFTATEVNGWMPNSGSSNDETTRTIGSYHPLTVKSDLGKPLYLHPVEQVGTYFYNDKDELVTRSGIPLSEINNQNSVSTRGTKVTDIGDEILVSAVSKKDNTEAEFFPFEKAKRSGNTWHTSNDKYWATDATLSFYAYAPTNASMLSESGSGLSKDRTVHYLAGTGDDIKSQPDFIVAKSEDNSRSATDAASAVDLHFSHALTAITFAVGKDMVPGKISKITVRGVKGEGDYNIATNTWNTDNVTANAEYTIDKLGSNGDGTITGEKDVALTNNDQTLLMIPQTLGSDAEVEIVFDNDNGAKTLTASLSGTSWEAGHSIIYKLSASEVTTLSLGNIEFPTNWSSQYTTTANKLKSAYDGTEKVGLFVVDDQGYIRNANVQLTYNSSTKSWNLPEGTNVLFSPRFKYFAYCNPTSTDLSNNLPQVGTKATNITDAASFFSEVINAWTPSSDQNTLSKLNACDLQIGMANISNTASSIDFNMTHAMGLADITLGKGLNYELSDKTYSWTSAMVNDQFEGNTPYQIAYNNYVAIVNPNTSTSFNVTKAKGWKGAWKNALTFKPNINDIEKLTAQRTTDENQTYTLALGDIYYKNGAITHNEEDLEPAAANTPIGIVGYIAQGGDDYWVEKNTKATGIGGHALVMGLKKLGVTVSTTDEFLKNYNYPSEPANPETYKGTSSYSWGPVRIAYINSSTAAINTKGNVAGSGYYMTSHQTGSSSAYQGMNKYNSDNATKAPDKSTGWFVATAGQYYALMIGLGEAGDCTWNIVNGNTSTIGTAFRKKNGSYNVTGPINEALKKVAEGGYIYTEFFGKIAMTELTASEFSSRSSVYAGSGIAWGAGVGSIWLHDIGGGGYGPFTIRPFLAF